ncbi:hypothetical protein M0R19_02075 [Candidatus Pacearchaeota archaeon]|jgi:hypothetical protein|nr:hypothetical protein [Candidatus Pacearchaeota archaeon]
MEKKSKRTLYLEDELGFHKNKTERLGKFKIQYLSNHNSNFGNQRFDDIEDSYNFDKKHLEEMVFLLHSYKPAKELDAYSFRQKLDFVSVIYHLGDCSVKLGTYFGTDKLFLSIYNKDYRKRIETLKILDDAFSQDSKKLPRYGDEEVIPD